MLPAIARVLHAGLAAATIALAAPALTADVATQIAVIDTERAVMETEDGLRMRATLKKLFDERQLQLDEKQNSLQKEREDLEKQRGVLSRDVLAQRAEKWQIEAAQVQQMFVEFNQELQKKQNELMQPILNQALKIVQNIATQDGYVMVVDKQAVRYFRPELDVTDAVIKAYNGSDSATGTAAPAPTPKASK